MLTLTNGPSCQNSDGEVSAPKYIKLKVEGTRIGRGYDNDVQLVYSWMSRKHLKISHIGEGHFLESLGQRNVQLNGCSVPCATLEEGDVISLGGSRVPGKPPMLVAYTYSRQVAASIEFHQPATTSQSKLMTLTETVDGRQLDVTYHEEDFNCTQTSDNNDLKPAQPVPSSATLSVMPEKCANTSAATSSTSLTKQAEPFTGTSRSTRCRKRPMRYCDGMDEPSTSSALAGPSKRSLSKKSTVVGPSLPKRAKVDTTVAEKNTTDVSTSVDCGSEDKKLVESVDNDASTHNDVKMQNSLGNETVKVEPSAGSDELRALPDKKVNAKVSAASTENANSEDEFFERKPCVSDETKRPRRKISNVTYKFDLDDSFDEEDLANKVVQKTDDQLEKNTAKDDSKIEKADELPELHLGKVQRSVDCDWLLSSRSQLNKVDHLVSKGKGGKGKRSKGRKNEPVVIDDAKKKKNAREEVVIASWKRDYLKPPKPKMELVLSGYYRKNLYTFLNSSIFKVTYKDGLKQHDWLTGEYDIDLHVDMALLQYAVRCGQLDMADLDKLIALIKMHSNKIDMSEFDEPHPALGRLSGKPCEQPTGLAVVLKDYQLNTLAWMVALEKHTHEWHVSKLLNWKGTKCDLLFDINNKRVFMPPAPPSGPSTMLKVTSTGGILADEMGLGKTITLLSLIATNTAEIPVIPDATGFDHRVDFYLPCRTTMVVAPSHLTAQWKHEVEKHMPRLTVLLITTKPQYEKLSYVDILRADIVIVSVPFLLTNKAFTSLPSGTDAETSFMQLMQKPGINPLLERPANLHHFRWWRLICDEGHELLTYEQKYLVKQGYRDTCSSGLMTLSRFTARHRWYVTGTPFPHRGRSLRAALKFLEVTVDDPTLMHPDGSLRVDVRGDSDLPHTDFPNSWPLLNLVRNQLYIRHTKTSIREQYDVPEYVEEVILLSMSDVERGVYERSCSELERRQLCCHLQIATRLQNVVGVQQRSLEEVRVALVEHTRKEINATRTRLEVCDKQLEKERADLARETKPAIQRMHMAHISRLTDSHKRDEAALTKHESALSYFDSIVPKICHSADEPCVVCLDNIDSLTVTPCGHLFCRGCIVSCVRQQGCCPTCRGSVNEGQLIEVKDASVKEEVDKSRELWKLTEQYGTKMAHLIFYLRHLFRGEASSRVIIFSQWDTMLHKIGSTLLDNGIKNVFVKGNVFVRNKAIMSFRKQETTRVIMLSLDNAASGTNLVEATHIVLIEPVAGTKEQAQAVEAQAIGRAHRMGQNKQIIVVRMLMQDTIEHELYKRNNSDSINQLEFNFNKPTAFGGPQIVRSVRKVPEPVQTAVPSTGDNESRTRNSSLLSANSFLNELMTIDDSDDSEDEDYGLDMFYRSPRKLPAFGCSDSSDSDCDVM